LDKNKIVNRFSNFAIPALFLLYTAYQFCFLFSSDLEEQIHASMLLAKAFSNNIILLTYFLIAKKNLNIKLSLYSLCISFILAYFNFFENIVHEQFVIYGLLQESSNTQYSRILFALLPLLFIPIQFIKRNKRSLSRSIVYTSYLILITVTFVYHQNIPQRLLVIQENNILNTMQTIINNKNEDFKRNCKELNYTCEQLVSTSSAQEEDIQKILSYHGVNFKFYIPSQLRGSLPFETEFPQRFVARIQKMKNQNVRIILATETLEGFKNQLLIVFYNLQFSLSFFWSLFSWFLIYFHKTRGVNSLHRDNKKSR